jgi:hypothetical protein
MKKLKAKEKSLGSKQKLLLSDSGKKNPLVNLDDLIL